MSPRPARRGESTVTDSGAPAHDVHDSARIGHSIGTPAIAQRMNAPRSPEEAEELYVAARNAWAAAMRAAASGRPADMASLAIAQEAYEAASHELERWRSGARVPIPIEPDEPDTAIDVVVGQELAWRDVHEHETKRAGLVGRLFGRGRRR